MEEESVANSQEETHELLERARHGDRQALETMLERYRPLLLKNSRRAYRSGLVEDEDLLQESAKLFLELIREFAPERQVSFGAYIKAKHGWRMANYARRERSRSSRVQALDELAAEPADEHDPFESMANAGLRDALAALTRRQREVLWRYYWLGQSADHIGRSMGIGVRAVHSLKRRAELRLRDLLST